MGAIAYRSAWITAVTLPLYLATAVGARAAVPDTIAELRSLSIEELANIQISSVSKKAEPLSEAAAAIYVITNNDILRSGATSVPEMLRLAPNLDVARINASNYAISARGFNGHIADKLLVLIDGRSVYTPIFAGVYWDMQYVAPQDVERIEVISGPGGSLWGANAVNGVINIITRKSSDTQGGLVNLSAGNFTRDANIQYGGRINADMTYRVYGNFSAILHNRFTDDTSAQDGWHKGQGGFRLDWSRDSDVVTVQGDIFGGSQQQLGAADQALFGGNVLARWNHTFDSGSSLQVQAYYDNERRSVPAGSSGDGDLLNSYDFDVQYGFALNHWNSVVIGGGKRADTYRVFGQPGFLFSPDRGTLHYGNVFIEDTIAFTDKLKLTAGIKLEDDAYVGLQPLPSARLSWKVTPTDMLWAAVSRAVRAPTPFDRDVQGGGPPPLLIGNKNFQSEKLMAYEVGYRGQPTSNSSLSISTYYNNYTELRSEGFTPTFFPIEFTNNAHGYTYGVEVWGNYQVMPWWTLSAGFKVRHQKLTFDVPNTFTGPLADFAAAVVPLLVDQAIGFTGNDADHQFSLRSSMDLPHNVALNVELREVGSLPQPAVQSYVELNAHIGWRVTKEVEVSLTASNLLHDYHVEFIEPPADVKLQRSFLIRVQRNF